MYYKEITTFCDLYAHCERSYIVIASEAKQSHKKG